MERVIPNFYHGVPGHLKMVEATFLYNIPLLLGEGNYANLGTCYGRSAVMIAAGLKESSISGKVFTIDKVELGASFFKEKNLLDLIEIKIGTTDEIFEQVKELKFNFVFIDADHSYPAVKRDFNNWSTLIKSNGLIAFHDSDVEGVKQVLDEIVGWKKLGQIMSLSWWGRE